MHYHVLIYDSGRVDRSMNTAFRMNPFENSPLCCHCFALIVTAAFSLCFRFLRPRAAVSSACVFAFLCVCLSFGMTAHTVLLGHQYLLGVGVFQRNIPLPLETLCLTN